MVTIQNWHSIISPDNMVNLSVYLYTFLPDDIEPVEFIRMPFKDFCKEDKLVYFSVPFIFQNKIYSAVAFRNSENELPKDTANRGSWGVIEWRKILPRNFPKETKGGLCS